MKKKQIIGITAVLTALTMILLSACGSSNASTAKPAESAGGSFTRTSWDQPFPETITVTIANVETTGFEFYEGDTITDSLWTKRWKDVYNINVETSWVSQDYELNMNLAIAAGDLPDMFYVNAVQFSQLLEAGLLEDITDYVASPYISNGMMNKLVRDALIFETTKVNGRSYAIPRLHYGYITQAPSLWVRNDWYNEAGAPALNTVADVEALMDEFMNAYDLSYTMILSEDLFGFWNSTPSWHSIARVSNGMRMWVDDGKGGIMSGYEQPELLDAIAGWRNWYEWGWIRPDFATTTWDNMATDIVSGLAGVEYGQNWRGRTHVPAIENFGPEAYWIAFAPPTIDGKKVQIPIQFPNDYYNVVRKGYEHPEILPMLCSDYVYVLDEASVMGTMSAADTKPFGTQAYQHISGPFQVIFDHYPDVHDVLDACATRVEKFRTGNAQIFYDEIAPWLDFDGNMDNFDYDVLMGVGRWAQMGHPHSSLAIAIGLEDNGHYVETKLWGPTPQEVLDKGGITDSIIQEAITRMIMGIDPLEKWDSVLEEWRQAGGNEMTAAVNEMYK